MLKKFKAKDQQQPIRKMEPQETNPSIEKPEPQENYGYYKFERDFKAYSDYLDKYAIGLMELKRELVKQQQLLSQRYEQAVEERDQVKASNERLVNRILRLSVDLQENAEKMSDKPLSQILGFLQADLFAFVEKEGVTKVPVKIGQVYDPCTCTAVPGPVDNNVPVGTITKELAPGYFYRSKKLQSAKVEVTKKGEASKQ